MNRKEWTLISGTIFITVGNHRIEFSVETDYKSWSDQNMFHYWVDIEL